MFHLHYFRTSDLENDESYFSEIFHFQMVQLAAFTAFKDSLKRIDAHSFERNYMGCADDTDENSEDDGDDDVRAPSDTSADSGTFLMITGEHGTGTFVCVLSKYFKDLSSRVVPRLYP